MNNSVNFQGQEGMKESQGPLALPNNDPTLIPQEQLKDLGREISKKKSSFVDMEKANQEAKELLRQVDADKVLREKLLFDQKDVSICEIYIHLNRPIDWFYCVLAIIGSIGSGVSMPIMSYISSDVYSDVGNTSEQRSNKSEEELMKETVKKTMKDQIKKQLIYGAMTFVCYFLSVCFWSLVGNRDVYNLKKKYFTTILAQEQGWFDSNNAFQFSTKVQAQLEQIEQGIGDKVGNILTTFAQCIIGFIFAFITSWKLTLVMLCTAPLIIFFSMFLMTQLDRKSVV